MAYTSQVFANAVDGRTSVEVLSGDDTVAIVFQAAFGWHVELSDPDRLRDPALVEEIVHAKRSLLRYVNRTGAGMPEGLTRAGAALWLMQRDDDMGAEPSA